MMNIKKIKELVQNGESHRLEFKQSTGSQSSAFKSLAAFLNSDGGIVLIGVKDNGKIVGQELNDKIQKALSHEISKIEPPAKIEISYVPLDDTNRHVIILEVQPGPHKPYVYDGRPYHREQTITKQMPQQLYDQQVAQRFKLNFNWETLIAEDYEIEDLDQTMLLGVVRKAVETERMPEEALRQTIPELLKALKLTALDHRVTNAAVALFGNKMTANFMQCQLKMARFVGIDRQEFMDEAIVYGNVFQLLDSGMKFVKRHLPVAAKIVPGKLERVETPLIPFDAIREALINSLIHRDYAVYGGSISLAIYDNRMEIFNNGGLLPGLSIQTIILGHSEPRNSIIADVFYRAHLIEKWGRGVPGIIRSCLKANDPEPEFVADARQFKVVFTFPRSLKPPVYEVEAELPSGPLTPRQVQILDILAEFKELSTKGILEKLEDSISERTLRNDLTELEDKNIIKSKGYTNKRTWLIIGED